MLKLKLQYFGHMIRRANSLEKTLMLGKTEGRRRRGQQRTGWLDEFKQALEDEFKQALRRTGKPGMLQSRGMQRVRQLSD